MKKRRGRFCALSHSSRVESPAIAIRSYYSVIDTITFNLFASTAKQQETPRPISRRCMRNKSHPSEMTVLYHNNLGQLIRVGSFVDDNTADTRSMRKKKYTHTHTHRRFFLIRSPRTGWSLLFRSSAVRMLSRVIKETGAFAFGPFDASSKAPRDRRYVCLFVCASINIVRGVSNGP